LNCKTVAEAGERTCKNQAEASAAKQKKDSPDQKKAIRIGKECTADVDAALKRCLKSANGANYLAMGAASFALATAMLF
jgi:hypothetical protein